MKILITNDDGINSLGIKVLAEQLQKDHEIFVVAPDDQRSASSHSITIHRPLVVKQVKLDQINALCFSVNGTPADCVKIALDTLLKDKADIIISGINNGYNLGTDVIYSGTVSAAIEGAIYKVPSIAVSMKENMGIDEYIKASAYVEKILKTACKNLIENDMVLNVNIPACKSIKGIKVCELGSRIYKNCYIKTLDKQMEREFRLSGTVTDSTLENTDVVLIKKGYTTVTPLHYDLTNFKIIRDIEKWFTQEESCDESKK